MAAASTHWRLLVPKLITTLRQGYDLRSFQADAIAGLTVAIVALPLAMALAIASGTTPDKGLYTAIVAGFLISALGGSRFQIGGPTGAFVVIVFTVIQQHGYDGLVLATLMAGVILIVAGLAGLGSWIKYIPEPVVVGFTSGIALIIFSSQIKDLFGLQISVPTAGVWDVWQASWAARDSVSWGNVGISFGALAAILLTRRYAPKLPGFLIAVVGASVVVYALDLPIVTIGSRISRYCPTSGMRDGLSIWITLLSRSTTSYTTEGAVVMMSISNSRSSRSCTISMCSKPKKPQRKPKPSACETSGSYISDESLSLSFSRESRS